MQRRTKIIIAAVITFVVGCVTLALLAGAGVVFLLFTSNNDNDDNGGGTCLNPGITADMSTPPATGSVAHQQVTNAKAIAAAVKKSGVGGDSLLVTLTAAMGESSLTVLNHGDAANQASRGLYQQTPSWGSEAQRMNVEYSTLSFLLGPKHDGKPHGSGGTGLAAIKGWQSMTPSEAIHAVQVNADPNHYTPFVAQAKQVAVKAGIDLDQEQPAASSTTAESSCGGASSDPGVGTGPCPLDSKAAPGKKNPDSCHKALSFVADQMTNHSHSWYRQCLKLVMNAYGWHSGPATARDAAQLVIDAGQMHHDTSHIPAGAVLWWDGSATGNDAGHVAIDDGKGYIYSNDVATPGEVSRVPWTYPAKSWGQKFLGWSAPYFPTAA